MDDLLDLLNQKVTAEEAAELVPEVGGLSADGLVGPWIASVMYTLGSEADYRQDEISYDLRRTAGSWGYFYYWKSKRAAMEAMDYVGAQYPPTTQWCFYAETGDIVNLRNPENWGGDIFQSLRVAAAGKQAHEWGLLALPAAVQAVARYQRIEVPEFPFEDLVNLPVNLTDADAEMVMEQLTEYRASLWQALGEDDASKYHTTSMNTEHSTKSRSLSQGLNLYYASWPKPLWLRLVLVRDPRVDALNKAGDKRLQLPVIAELFTGEKQAREALGESVESQTTSSVGAPPIPAMWAELPGDWREMIDNIVNSGKPLPVAYNEAGGEDVLGATVKEVKDWVEYVKSSS